jgi:DNA-binding response OmpR family regulator
LKTNRWLRDCWPRACANRYAVDLAADSETALFQIGTTDYDAVLLDVMLPTADGFTVCRAIRQAGCAVPILMVTACDSIEARIQASMPAPTIT